MAKNTAAAPEGLDPATLIALLQQFGPLAPQVLALVQTLLDAWKKKQSGGLQATPKCAASPTTAYCCDCCDAALKSAMETVANLLECKDCCTP